MAPPSDDISTMALLRDLEHLRTLADKLDRRDETSRLLADRVLHLALAVEKNTEQRAKDYDLALRNQQRLTEIYEQREFIREGYEELRREMAVLTSLVKNALEEHKREEQPSIAIKLLDRFAKAPKVTQALIVMGLIAIALGGWWSRIADWFGGGH